MHQITYMREAMDDHKKAAKNFNERLESFVWMPDYHGAIPTVQYWELHDLLHEKHGIEEWLKLAEKHFHESMKHRLDGKRTTKDTALSRTASRNRVLLHDGQRPESYRRVRGHASR